MSAHDKIIPERNSFNLFESLKLLKGLATKYIEKLQHLKRYVRGLKLKATAYYLLQSLIFFCIQT